MQGLSARGLLHSSKIKGANTRLSNKGANMRGQIFFAASHRWGAPMMRGSTHHGNQDPDARLPPQRPHNAGNGQITVWLHRAHVT